MCQHYWRIDSCNNGICKLCGEAKDFQLEIDKVLGDTGKTRGLKGDLCPIGDYYMQGSIRKGTNWLKIDYCFSVDDII